MGSHAPCIAINANSKPPRVVSGNFHWEATEMKARFSQKTITRTCRPLLFTLCPILLANLCTVARASESDVAAFYRGRTINLIAGFSPGGGADTHARLLARHISTFIPGNPSVVVRNMQGAGSLNAANYIYNISPKDGTELGLFTGNITTAPLIFPGSNKYDARQFNWIGAPSAAVSVCISSLTSKFRTIKDVIEHEMIIGTTGTGGNSTYDFPTVLNNVMGAKLRLVKGYAGSAALNLAMSRNEIEGFCGVGYDFLQGVGLAEGKANILVQLGLRKSRYMPNVPFIMDYAKNDEDRQIFNLVFGWLSFERPVGAPPKTPPERVNALRAAFDSTMKDPSYLEDAKKVKVDIEPMSGLAISNFLQDVYKASPTITKKAAEYIGRTGQ